MKEKKPLVLAILDGWGVGPKDKDVNAIHCAKTPFFDFAEKEYPSTQLEASGVDVGLEKGQMSGSETGHLNIGAGRVVTQDVRVILQAIDDGSFFQNPVFLSMISRIKKNCSNVHLVGLLGNNDSPHAHPDILIALLILLKERGMNGNVFLHLFTDGRDSFPSSAKEHWQKISKAMDSLKAGKLATISGRYYGMDRAKNWERLKKSYNAMVLSEGEKYESFEEAIEENYRKGNMDEFVEPSVMTENGKPVAKIDDKDGVIFFNFRSDRARQFTKLFVGTKTKREKDFPEDRKVLKDLSFIAMTDFGPDLNLETAYPSNPLTSTLPGALASRKQLYISENEKFAHVTYFINGGYPDPIAGEERVMIESAKVKSYAEKPQMSAQEMTDVILKSVQYGVYDTIVVNYPNTDMVGHTGNFKAVVQAAEFVDKQLARIFDETKKKNGTLVLTADHGNADVMVDKETKQLFTFHTKNPVPFVVVSEENKKVKLGEGVLGNIAPTVLDLLETKKPEEMKLDSLITKK